jgi:diguanylate cyclase (GGDEF)-like protein
MEQAQPMERERALMTDDGATWWSSSNRSSDRWTGPVAFLAVTIAYLFFAQLVLWFNDPVLAGAGLWPAAGVTVAALLLLPNRSWGWVVAAIVVAELGGDLAHGYGVVASAGWTLGNVVEPLVGASLIRRSGNVHGALRPVRNLVLFVAFGVLVAPLVGATVGTTTSVLVLDMPFLEVWPKYVMGDALGVLVVAPAVLALRVRPTGRSRAEAAALSVVSLGVCAAVFGTWGGAWLATMPYLLMPCLTWAALRFGVRGVAWLAFAVTLIGNAATAVGDGPFAQAGGPTGQSITMLQVFLAISVSCSLLLAALVDHLTDRERIEERWRHEATHDPLTGLANRSLLDAALLGSLPEATETRPLHLVMCDLDNFKTVNDSWGHAAGDELLRVIAGRMESAVRPDDVVARISGDEFVLLLKGTDEAAAGEVAGRVMAAVVQPVQLPSGNVVVPSLSMGVAAHQQGEAVARLMARADETMYRAKALGGGRVQHSPHGSAVATS